MTSLDWKQHLVFGFFIFLITFGILKRFNVSVIDYLFVAGLVITLFYSLLPDFDMDNSKINNLIEMIILVSAFVFIVMYYYNREENLLFIGLTLIGIDFFSKFLKHRGEFHTITVGLILSFILIFVSPILVLFAFVGWMSHLIADGVLKF